MVTEIVSFKRPVTVVQAFHHHYSYGKKQRRLDSRRDAAAWQQQFQSVNGFADEGQLLLPDNIANDTRLKQATHLFLDDVQNPDHFSFREFRGYHAFNLHQGLPGYDAFKFKSIDGVAFEIFLYWSFYEFWNTRQYKIAELHPGMVLEIRRNKVTNFSMSARRARVVTEAFTNLQILGTFQEATVLRSPIKPVLKKLPAPTKVIDQMKHFY